MEKQYQVGVIIFDEVEVLDFTGPYEVFSVSRFPGQSYDTSAQTPFEVKTIAENDKLIKCRYGLKVKPDDTFENIEQMNHFDIIVVPGGLGVRKEIYNHYLIEFIQNRQRDNTLITSVCTGALLLAEAGLLNGKKATTHYKSLDKLAAGYPEVTVVRDQKVVDEGEIITSAGVASGIEMALYVVEKFMGESVAYETKKFMEYK